MIMKVYLDNLCDEILDILLMRDNDNHTLAFGIPTT